MTSENRQVAVCHLGLAEYRSTWNLQKSIQQRLIDAKRSDPPHDISHVMLTVEHPPVYTLGKSGKESNLLLDGEGLSHIGATFEHIDRGGDITFHGPGQLVVYPILDLGRFYTDIHRYLRDLEETVIRTCTRFGLVARRSSGRTGVWVGTDGEASLRKICSMGIKCSRWVTCHGLALNVDTDLSYFAHIVPCGIVDADVTSLSRELGTAVKIQDVLPVFLDEFGKVLPVQLTEYLSGASHFFLEKYLSAQVNT